jgi:hypothetical protein
LRETSVASESRGERSSSGKAASKRFSVFAEDCFAALIAGFLDVYLTLINIRTEYDRKLSSELKKSMHRTLLIAPVLSLSFILLFLLCFSIEICQKANLLS